MEKWKNLPVGVCSGFLCRYTGVLNGGTDFEVLVEGGRFLGVVGGVSKSRFLAGKGKCI